MNIAYPLSFSLSLPSRNRCDRSPSLLLRSPLIHSTSLSVIKPYCFSTGFFDEQLDGDGILTYSHGISNIDLNSASHQDEIRQLSSPVCVVKELEELPEQWRRSRLAWLCKELPSHKPASLIKVLNAQRKWMNQEDTTYVVVHCMRIRENEAGFRVYKWMCNQHWYRFDFALSTKLADYMGKERKFAKCREIFDDIIKQGRVPSESTFHILIVAYLNASIQGCLDEACNIYNRMIQLGGYRPRLSLHNSLFKALVNKPGGTAKYYLKQAEFIFHNLVTCDFEILEDIYVGLIWLHSYQDVIDRERIKSLRLEMNKAGLKENANVLISIMRAASKEGDVDEIEKIWLEFPKFESKIPCQAYIYRMDAYAKIGKPMKSLEIFIEVKEMGVPINVVMYHKIIDTMSKAQEREISETLMMEFMESGMKPLLPSFIDLMNMYLDMDLHDSLQRTFDECIMKCQPNRTAYNIYLDSLIRVGDIKKAEEIFNEMLSNGSVGVNSRSCNSILHGYLNAEENTKAEKIYDLMGQKKYDIEHQLMQKMEYVLITNKKVVKKQINLKLDNEQREVLIGLLLGGIRVESDEKRRNHAVHFEFNEESEIHSILKIHIHSLYYEWLNSVSRQSNENDDTPYQFSTIAHSCFGYYADQFWPKGRPAVPSLIHRWLSPRVLAYWYMFAGQRTSSGFILLKLKSATLDDIERIGKVLKSKSIDCKFKRKGRVSWIGLQNPSAELFWQLIEPYILDSLKDLLKPFAHPSCNESIDEGIAVDS